MKKLCNWLKMNISTALNRSRTVSVSDQQNAIDRYVLCCVRLFASTGEFSEPATDDLTENEPALGAAVFEKLKNKVVMVTGAAGSIGSELCRQILRSCPSKLVVLDRNETGLFYLQAELGDDRVTVCVADYTNTDAVQKLFAVHRVQLVFHAAAYKHVPLMEDHPREALQNNVFGLCQFLDVAETSGCETFILISTDKAVNPANVMGCTKRIGELIVSSRPASRMRCVAVRFGNVLGSQGSVVPIFQKQIAEGSALTVTHPEATRFFVTRNAAAAVVLQATIIGCDRHILLMEMGEPVRILDLARTLIRMAGKREDEVDVVFTGLREGEKLHEEMFAEAEVLLDTSCAKIKQTQAAHLDWKKLKSCLDTLHAAMPGIDDFELRSRMRKIVPEYSFGAVSQLC